MRQERQQQGSGANERETSGGGAPRAEGQKWGESEKRGEQTLKNSVLDSGGPGLIGASRPGCGLSRGQFCLLCVPLAPAPHPRGQQKPLPEHAGPTHWVAEAGASQGSQREPVSRQEKAFRPFVITLSKNTTLPPLRS